MPRLSKVSIKIETGPFIQHIGNNIGITAVRFMQNQSGTDPHRCRNPDTRLNEDALGRHFTLWPERKDNSPPGASLQTRKNFIEAIGAMYECYRSARGRHADAKVDPVHKNRVTFYM